MQALLECRLETHLLAASGEDVKQEGDGRNINFSYKNAIINRSRFFKDWNNPGKLNQMRAY